MYAFAFVDVFFNMTYELMKALPQDYKKTVECIRQHLTDEEVSNILSSPDYMTSNRRIIMTLITRMKGGEELFKFFDILKLIKDAPHLPDVVESFRNSKL